MAGGGVVVEGVEKNRSFFRNIASYMADGVLVLDMEGMIVFSNPESQRLLGWSGAELAGRPLRQLVHGEEAKGVCPGIEAARQGGTHRSEDYTFKRKDGSSFHVSYVIAPMHDDDGFSGLVMVFRDITDTKVADREREALIAKLKTAHEQLLQAEKMASIGQLAAGVAHEINNPVGYLGSNLGTLQDYARDLFQLLDLYRRLESEVPLDSRCRDDIETFKGRIDLNYLHDDVLDLIRESLEGIERVKKIVQDLKDFSHVEQAEWQWADLHRGLDSTLNIVNNELKYKADVVREYGQLPAVECVISQMNQVFMNILVNAAQAIEQHGTITVRTGMEGADWVWIEFSDTGKGIPADNLNRIFDPFFTTKSVGKGTGLGLSISYGIVEKHGGTIIADSEVGKGTTFRITLPVAQPDTQPVADNG